MDKVLPLLEGIINNIQLCVRLIFQRKESKAIKSIIFLNMVFFASGNIFKKVNKVLRNI